MVRALVMAASSWLWVLVAVVSVQVFRVVAPVVVPIVVRTVLQVVGHSQA